MTAPGYLLWRPNVRVPDRNDQRLKWRLAVTAPLSAKKKKKRQRRPLLLAPDYGDSGALLSQRRVWARAPFKQLCNPDLRPAKLMRIK